MKTLGIEKGKPFNPTTATEDAAETAAVKRRRWLEAKYDAGFPPFYPGEPLDFPAATPDMVKAGAERLRRPEQLSGRHPRRGLHATATSASSASAPAQFYLIAIKDKDGNAFDGSSTYRLTVPPMRRSSSTGR